MNGPDAGSAPEASPGRGAGSGYDPYWEWLAILLRRRRLILGVALLACLATTGPQVFRPRTYVVQASFVTRAGAESRTNRSLASLVAGSGIHLPSLLGGNSSYFVEVITARDVLQRVASATYQTSDGTIGSLVEITERRGRTPEERMVRTVSYLRRAVTARQIARSNKVVFSVETRWPEVSLAIAERLLDQVSRFNIEVTQEQGRAEREFLDDRLESAGEDVRAWEDSLQVFLASNRDFGPYSQQRFEHDRLSAELQRSRTVYTQLTQHHEQALLTETREGLTITVLDSPQMPIRGRSRLSLRWLFRALVSTMMGVAVGIFVAFMAEGLSKSGTSGLSVAIRTSVPSSSLIARFLTRALGTLSRRRTSSTKDRFVS